MRNDDAIFLVFFAKEPTVVVLAMPEQDVEVVIAKDALGSACCDETLDEIDDCWAITAQGRKLLERAIPSWKVAQERVKQLLGTNIVTQLNEAMRQISEATTAG